MSNAPTHISEYRSLGKILVILLSLTFLTIFITQFDLKAWNVTIALVIACVKVFLVLSYFMHLKYEGLLFKILVGMVFLLFFLVIAITFVDYLFR
jgi:cytochrome c oxidase subunit IV